MDFNTFKISFANLRGHPLKLYKKNLRLARRNYFFSFRGLGGLVVIHSVASAKGLGFNSPVAKYIRDLILVPLQWQASSVGYSL